MSVPFSYSWAITANPPGAQATLTQAASYTPLLAPDVAGVWGVTFTACPSRCSGYGVVIPPLTRTVDFTAVRVIEGRVSSDQLEGELKFLLADTLIQISHTGNGTTVQGTPYKVQYRRYDEVYKRLCVDKSPPAPVCPQLLKNLTSQANFTVVTPQLNSFIKFGAPAQLAGAPADVEIPVPTAEFAVPDSAQVILSALQPIIGSNIDRVRLLANNIHLNLSSLDKWSASIGDGGININASLDSSHPTIKCEDHWNNHLFYFIDLGEGWSDEPFCDFDLSRMDLSVKLIPAARDGAVAVVGGAVHLNLAPRGLQSELIKFLSGATSQMATEISGKISDSLFDAQTSRSLGNVLFNGLKKNFPGLIRVDSLQVVGSDLVVEYECASCQ